MIFENDNLNLDKRLGYMVKDTVFATACELTGEKGLEKQMKKSCLNK